MHRITAFATNTWVGQLSAMELRHRRRARCEDRILEAKDTGLASLPLQGFGQNRIWLAILALAMDLKAWMQTLALTEPADQAGQKARRWEPKKLRIYLYSISATLARHARQAVLTIADHAPTRESSPPPWLAWPRCHDQADPGPTPLTDLHEEDAPGERSPSASGRAATRSHPDARITHEHRQRRRNHHAHQPHESSRLGTRPPLLLLTPG